MDASDIVLTGVASTYRSSMYVVSQRRSQAVLEERQGDDRFNNGAGLSNPPEECGIVAGLTGFRRINPGSVVLHWTNQKRSRWDRTGRGRT